MGLSDVLDELRVGDRTFAKLLTPGPSGWMVRVLNKRDTPREFASYQHGVVSLVYFRLVRIEGPYSQNVADCTIHTLSLSDAAM